MNTITIRYTANGATQTMAIDGDKHNIADVLERCRRRVFPGVEPPEHDPVFDVIIARMHNAQKFPNPLPPGDRPDPPPAPPARSGGDSHGGGVRDTSRDALHRHQASGKLGKQEMLVYGFVRGQPGEDFTRQEIARALNLGINAVCGRVNALVNDHAMLRETRRRTCRVTGESVMAVGTAA